MAYKERYHWYKSPSTNSRNGRIISVPYGADEFHVESCDLRFADVMLEIYRPYVEKTAVSFELEAPTEDEFTERVRRGLKSPYPWLLACVGNRLVGYAHAQAFHPHAAYARSVETTIYIAQEERRKGYGQRLYTVLEAELRKRGYSNVYACIAYSARRDPYLTTASVRFHARLGYTRMARFVDCAEKFGRLYSMIWMGKRL